jgi:lipid-A-disaccharide synthase
MTSAAPHVFVVAGEESGDRLGAALIAALRRRTEGRVRISAIGGERMAQLGAPSLLPIEDLAIIGFTDIPARLPKILSRIRQAAAAVIASQPDVLVIIDSPDFTHRVARRVRARAPGIPIVDYVCPSVWAWRPGRAKAMRSYVDHVLTLLPFEPAALQRLAGPPGTYVGHPLIEQIAGLRPAAAETERRLAAPPSLVVLPGSRRGEIRRMAPVFGETLGLLAKHSGELDVVVPAVTRLEPMVRQAVATWPVPARVVTEASEKYAAFRRARAALTKSGTSTLELALAGVPMVAAYKLSVPEAVVAGLLLKVNTVILANLVLGESVVPEFLQLKCTPKRLASALLPLLSDTPERCRQIEAFARLDAVMGVGRAPSDLAAEIVLGCAGDVNRPTREVLASVTPEA